MSEIKLPTRNTTGGPVFEELSVNNPHLVIGQSVWSVDTMPFTTPDPAPSVDDVVTITLNKKLAEKIKRGAEKDAYYWTAVCDDSYADLRAIVDACEAALAAAASSEPAPEGS